MKVLIIIPAYNEEKRIGNTLKEYSSYFENLRSTKFDYEILVVINATTDKTEEIVKGFKKKFKRINYLNFKEAGKGFAVKQGFIYGIKKNFDLIGFVDADMATSPAAFYDLIKNINDYDGIIASRYVKNAKVFPKPTLQRIIVSRVFNFLVRVLFLMPYKDTQCGAKLFKKEIVKVFVKNAGLTNWAFDVDLLYIAKKNNYIIKENPTIWRDKEGSRLNLKKASLQMFFAVVQLKILNSKAKIFYKILKPIGGFIYNKLK